MWKLLFSAVGVLSIAFVLAAFAAQADETASD